MLITALFPLIVLERLIWKHQTTLIQNCSVLLTSCCAAGLLVNELESGTFPMDQGCQLEAMLTHLEIGVMMELSN